MQSKTPTPFYRKAKFWLSLGVGLILLLLIGNNLSNAKDQSKFDKAAIDQRVSSSDKDDKMSDSSSSMMMATDTKIEDLRNDYAHENQIAADKKYKDKVLKITGVVTKEVESTFGNGYDVTIDGGNATDNQFETTQLVFQFDKNTDVSSLKNGQTYTFTGKLSHIMLLGGNTADDPIWPENFTFTDAKIVTK